MLVNVVLRIPGLREVTFAGARLQILVGIPALLFVPGYVLVAAAFPGRSDPDDRETDRGRTIDLVERAALSFGMSVALVPLFALAVGSGWGLSLPVALTGYTVLLGVGVAFAAVRRLRLPPQSRHRVPARAWAADLRRSFRSPESAFEGAANIALALAVLLAVGAAGFAVATPYWSGPSSTFYLATENENGTLSTNDYPTSFTPGEGQPLVAGIVNDEEQTQQYTVVVALERVEDGSDGVTVVESNEIDRLQADVADGEEWTQRHTVTPEMTGEDLRLHYYLYRGGSAPAQPDAESAYRDTYIWIDVGGT